MAVSVFKTWISGEILSAADLNSSFTQITGNGEDLGWPATKAKDLDGNELIFDSDGDTSITVDTDDQFDVKVGGSDVYKILAGSFGLASDDGASLGISGTAWSDLFLASGGVINFNAGNVTITHSAGQLSLGDATVSRANLLDYGEVTNAIGSIGGGAQAIDLTLGNVVTATVDTSETTFSFTNPTASDELSGFTIVLTNGGSQTVNWPASVRWAYGAAPTLTSSGVDILNFFTVDGGTTWYGFVAGVDML